MAKCYPRIKDYCREKHGLEFQVRILLLLHNDRLLLLLFLSVLLTSGFRVSGNLVNFLQRRYSISVITITLMVGVVC